MHFQLSGKTLSEYFSTGKLPYSVRPVRCKHCKTQGRFHRHSSYCRKKIFLHHRWCRIPFFVQRFRCVACGKVFSLIPHFLYKWQQASLLIQERVVFNRIKSRKQLSGAFHLRTLARWKQRWRQRAHEQQPKILQHLFSRKADIDVNAPISDTREVLPYLHFLWRQVPSEMPSLLVAVSLLHFGSMVRRSTPQNLSSSFSGTLPLL